MNNRMKTMAMAADTFTQRGVPGGDPRFRRDALAALLPELSDAGGWTMGRQFTIHSVHVKTICFVY